MKAKTKRRVKTAGKEKAKNSSTRFAIVPALSELRLGSLQLPNADILLTVAQTIADRLAVLLPEKGLVTELPSRNPNVPPKRYVKVDGWTIAGAMLGVVPIEESCEQIPNSNGYKAVVRLERVCDNKTVGRASAVCFLDESANTDFAGEEFATYSKTITRASGKAFRLTYGWLMKLAGFEGTPAEELYEVEGSETASEDVARGKIEEKLGRKFDTLADAEAALMDQKEAKKQERETAKTTAFIEWPDSHNGHRFLLKGKAPIIEHGLWKYITEDCGGSWSDRESGWFINAGHYVAVCVNIRAKGIPIVVSRNMGASSTQDIAEAQPEVDRAS